MSLLKRRIRLKRKEYRFGKNAKCEICGEKDLRTLDDFEGKTLCRRCRLAAKGRSVVEKHHFSGRHNNEFTVDLPANEHAILSDYQQDWPKTTLENPNGDLLIKIAAPLRAIKDLHAYSVEQLPLLALRVEKLSEFLANKYGADWAEGFNADEIELTK